MSGPARFAVVGCSECESLWILEHRHEHETTTCPACWTTHATKDLRARFQHDDSDVVCEIRAQMLAQRAGYGDRYETADDYALQAERAEEYLARYDELFGADIEEGIERQGRIQHGLFEADAEEVLDQEERYESAAEIYLRRRERELEQLVTLGEPLVEEGSDVDPTPFSERSEPSNVSLSTPETLPDAVDVRLSDPPIAPTDVWQQLWQTAAMGARFRDALNTLNGADYRSAWATLTETWGATALNDDDVPFGFASYTLDALKQPSTDRWYDVVRLSRQLGGPTVLGQSSREDISNGPIAIFAGSEVTPSIAIHLSHEFFEHKRIQRVRFLEFLVELSRGLDVRIVCHGSLAPKKLLHFHEADLPTSAVTEAPQAYQNAVKRHATNIEAVATDALDELGIDHAAISVLERLDEEDNERLEFSALKAADAFDVTEAAVGKRVRTLIDHRLVSKDQLNTSNYIQLLPAGRVFLDRREQEREAQNVQTVIDGFTDAENDDSSEVTDPSNHSHGTVYASASTGRGEDGEASPSAETVVDVDGVEDDIVASGEWLSTDQQTAVSSAVTGDIDIALADEPAPSRDHCGDYQVGFDEEEREIIVSFQPSPMAARTVTRLCAALLDPRLRNSLLTADQLDGEAGEELGTLLEEAVNPTVLRAARQLGWLPDRAANGEDYPDQLVSAMQTLLADVEEIGEGEAFDPELARSVCRRGQGLAGTITHIYDLLGWDVTREFTFPEYSRHFHEDRSTHLKTLATQLAITSRYGHYPMSRIVYEERADKRDGSLGAPAVDDIDPSGDIIGSWVLRGPGIDRLAGNLAHLEAYADLEVQEDSENFAAFYADIRIGQATRRESVREAVDRLCRAKNMDSTRPATALLYALSGSVYSTATALTGLATAHDFERQITLDEVRYALSTLNPDALLPDLDVDEDGSRRRSARSKLVHTLLTATEPLAQRELADRASVSTESIRTHRDDLEALGLLVIDDRGVGKATYYRLRLPFSDECGDHDAPRPLYLPEGEGERSMYSVRDVVHDVIEARGLLDEAYADKEISDGLAGWPPTLEPAVSRWPWLRPWINTICRLFGRIGGGSIIGPGEWIDGPYELVSRFGTEPATTQSQFSVQKA